MAIDLNSDLGEGVGEDPDERDATLLSIISSANVACGGHAGDPDSMSRVCEIAVAHKVAIGAHISYEDKAGFGRRPHDSDASVLKDQLLGQLYALDTAARSAGSAVTYIKPHGELYHDCINNPERSMVVVGVALEFERDTGRRLALLCMPGAPLLQQAEPLGIVTATEAFADRAYRADGQLVPRGQDGALVTDTTQALERLKRLMRDDEIVAIDGTRIEVRARSICIHGDTPGAVAMARRIKAAIDSDRVRILPFAPPPRAVG